MLRRTTARAWILSALGVSLSACGGDSSSAEGSASGTTGTGTATTSTTTGSTTTATGTGTAGTSGVDGTSGMTTGVDGTTTGDTGTTDDGNVCMDADGDGYGTNCAPGPDCNDDDDNVWTDEGCANCMDADADNHWVGCDQYDDDKLGPDCDDNDDNVFTDRGCANCVDADMDMVWSGCDVYDDDKTGPDCDDGNPEVGTDDAVEICDGLAQNCAGEIDPLPADEMCPPAGVNSPNVGTWVCDPPMPGQDGCTIQTCEEQFFDIDGQLQGGCECAGTSRDESLAACSGAPAGYLGSVTEGTQLTNLPLGTIPLIDNGIGAGAEDWYWVEFPEGGNPGTRPQTGQIRVDFAQNDGNDYRFEVFRTCNGLAWSGGLATQYGAGAPPAREWWFFDNHTAPVNMPVPAKYTNNVTWPSQVYIRVFRVQNDATCNSYQLSIQRVAN